MTEVVLRLGECLVVISSLEDESLVANITDPPYEINFMAKKWDGSGIAFSPVLWDLIYKKLVPGGLVKVFSATRTFHKLANVLEQTGFVGLSLECWGYGSGFPHTLNIAKEIDKFLKKQESEEAQPWIGYSTGFRPSWEPFLVAHKP